MATQIKLRRDTYSNWYDSNPVLGLAEPGFDTTNKKLKIGDGTTLWRDLPYFDDQQTDLLTVAQDIIPDADNTRNIGSPDRRWQHGYFASGSLYVGDLKISNNAGTLLVQQVTDAGLISEAPVPNAPGVVTTDRVVNGANNFSITASGTLIPGTDNLQDIGTPTARIRHIYVGPGSVTIGDSIITESVSGKLVLPGVTRATTLFANEVEDTGDQTRTWVSGPFLLDAYHFGVSSGSITPPQGYSPADYDNEGIDDDGYIDGISVYTPGVWTQAVADYNRTNNMYAYIGSNVQESFNPSNWVQIPFSVRAKADDVEYEFNSSGGGSITVSEIDGDNDNQNEVSDVTAIRFDSTTGFSVTDLGDGEVKVSLGSSWKTWQVAGEDDLVAVGEDTVTFVAGTNMNITTNAQDKTITFNATGGGTGAVEIRGVEFPNGEEGDTRGTLADAGEGGLYYCTQDWTAPNDQPVEYNIVTSEAYNKSQSQGGLLMSAVIAVGDYPAIDAIMQALGEQTVGWQLSGNTTDGYTRNCTAQIWTNNRWAFTWDYVSGQDNSSYDQGEEFTLYYTAQNVAPIWEQISTGNANTGDLVFNNNTITSSNANDDIEIYGGEDGGAYSGVNLISREYAQINYSSTGSPNANDGVNNYYWVDESGASVQVYKNNDGETDNYNHNWKFNTDGSFEFPDGTKQTTAYTGQTSGGTSTALYMAVNVDGNVMSSTDGVNWTDATDLGTPGLGTVAVGPGKIIYTRSDINGDGGGEAGGPGTGLYTAASPTATPTLIDGTDGDGTNTYFWLQVQYFAGTTYPWVAVGYLYNVSDLKQPILAYSINGVNWSYNMLDGGSFLSTNDFEFTDIAYGNGHYLISSRLAGSSSSSLWSTTDLTVTLTGSNWVEVEDDFKAVEYFGIGGTIGYRWLAFTTTAGFFATNNSDPTIVGDWSQWEPSVIADIIFQETGLTNQTVEEVTSGLVDGSWTFMTSSSSGHIVWWPNEPIGPFVSLPNPYTSTITDIVRNNEGDGLPTTIVFTGDAGPNGLGEKITISGVTTRDGGEPGKTNQSYNGTYYIKRIYNGGVEPDTFELYTDQALTTPWDTGTYWPVNLNTGTLTWSHGQYLDSLGFANGHFYVGNDDEQMFKSVFTNGELTWTKVDDKNNSLMYWNDFAYYSEFSSSASSSVTIAQAAPSGSNGALWFNSVDGRMYIKYSNQWIDASPTEVNSNQVLLSAGGSIVLEGVGDNEAFGYETLLDIVTDSSDPNALTIRNRLCPNYGLEFYVQDEGAAEIARGDGLGSDTDWLSVSTDGTTTISDGAENANEWQFKPTGEFVLPTGKLHDPEGNGETLVVSARGLAGIEYFDTPLAGTADDTVISSGVYSSINGAGIWVNKRVDSGTTKYSSWQFDKDGNLTVPTGGNIIGGGMGRYATYDGDTNDDIVLSAGFNGQFLHFNGSNGNMVIRVPHTTDAPIQIGFIVTIVMDDFNGNIVYINNDYGTDTATINAVGFAPGTSGGWTIGASGNVTGIYTLMKVDTDRWILSGPDVQVD